MLLADHGGVQLLLKRGSPVPGIVVHTLIFIYEEQKGCMKLAGHQSEIFSIKNGTRQGSVASPTFFSVYLDVLL